jgi:nucleotide-binding universal stress UspA family protein
VFRPIFPAMPGPTRSNGGESRTKSDIARLRKETVAHFAAAATARIGLNIVIDVGQPASRIVERAASLPADLIVIGTHGTSGFEHLLLGSLTEKVLRKATCPVLTVPPRAQVTPRPPFEPMLCAVDFSDSSITGLAEYRRYCERSAMTRIEPLVPDSARASHPPVTRLRSGKPYVQILDVAAAEQSDLIIIGVRGREPLDVTLFGSTTNQVVRRARCNGLTLRR